MNQLRSKLQFRNQLWVLFERICFFYLHDVRISARIFPAVPLPGKMGLPRRRGSSVWRESFLGLLLRLSPSIPGGNLEGPATGSVVIGGEYLCGGFLILFSGWVFLPWIPLAFGSVSVSGSLED